MNINKVRRVLKAQSGLQTPFLQNSIYWDSSLGKTVSVDPNLQWKDRLSSTLGNPYIMLGTLLPRVINPTGDNIEESSSESSLKWDNIGKTASWLGSLIKRPADGKYGAIKLGGDLLFDFVSNSNPYLKPLGFASDVLTNFTGAGTDNETWKDAVLGSKFLFPIGAINGWGGKRTLDFSADKLTIEQIGGAYGGTVTGINRAVEKSGKKYGLFSSGERKATNRFINKIRGLQKIMADIADEATDKASIAANMSDLNHIQYGFNLNGGYDLRYLRAAKFGTKLKRVKRINFRKLGGEIKGVINLDKEWIPEIIDPIELFEEGGKVTDEDRIKIIEDIIKVGLEEEIIEWTPTVIDSFQNGGKTKEEPEETTLKNVIPEGALHAHKHHMDNAEELTKKGIPVIDNEGDLQAEIEREEIIFTLEVTKKLEELYEEGTDEAAIEAGKLLVLEILFNTEDRTGLINTLKQGGLIDVVK